MTTETTDYNTAIAEIAPNLEYSAVFVPQSQGRNAAEKMPTINWRVVLRSNGLEVATDYHQGIGHVPGLDVVWGRRTVHQAEQEQRAAEKGIGRIRARTVQRGGRSDRH